MGREYIRIEPSTERLVPEDIVNHYEGFRKISNSVLRRINPIRNPPNFETLLTAHSPDEPTRMYLGVNEDVHSQGLVSELETIYPNSYDIYEQRIPFRKETMPERSYEKILNEKINNASSSVNSEADFVREPITTQDYKYVDPVGVQWFGKGKRRSDWMTLINRYTQQAKRHQRQKEARERRERASPLASLINTMAEIEYPVAYQVVFQRRRFWPLKARRKKLRVETGFDGVANAAVTTVKNLADAATPQDTQQARRDRYDDEGESRGSDIDDQGEDLGGRKEHVDAKRPSKTFRTNIRALAFLPDDISDSERQRVDEQMAGISNAFNHLSGSFYAIQGHVVKNNIWSKLGRRPTPGQLLDDFVNRDTRVTFTTRKRTQFTFNSDELANFTHYPSEEYLTQEGVRSIQTKERTRAPLPLPDWDTLEQYQGEGVRLGYPLNEHGEKIDDPMVIPPSLLTNHYFRSAGTGSGKSVAAIWDMLSFNYYTDGPNILMEPKGGDMCVNYLLAHYTYFNTLDDVVYIKLPEMLPASPFFDIRPKVHAGYPRKDAVQDRVDQFDELMKLVMDEDQYKNAQNSINLIKLMMKAEFDPKYGTDAYPLTQLYNSITELVTENTIPNVSGPYSYIENRLQSMRDSEDQQFSAIVSGALNRLDHLMQDDRLRNIFNHVPEWDDEAGTYEQGLNFHELLKQDKTIIFDLGDLRGDSAKILQLLYVSYLWDVAQVEESGNELFHAADQQRTPSLSSNDDDRVIGCVIEEAREIAGSDLVSELLSQGRGFNVSLGLIMQFPSQLKDDTGESDMYDNLIENVGTKILGSHKLADDIAESISSEAIDAEEFAYRLRTLPDGEWIVDIKGTQFLEEEPRPFSIRSLEPPRGTMMGPDPIDDDELEDFTHNIFASKREEWEDNYCVPEEDIPDFEDMSKSVDDMADTGTIDSRPTKGTASDADDGEVMTDTAGSEHGGSTVDGSDNEFKKESLLGDDESLASDGSAAESPQGPPPAPEEKTSAAPFDDVPTDDGKNIGVSEDALSIAGKYSTVPNPNGANSENGSDVPAGPDVGKLYDVSTTEICNEHGLNKEDVYFMLTVHQAVSNDLNGYSLLNSMTNLPYRDEADIETLEDYDFIETCMIERRKYYDLTPKGRNLIGQQKAVGEGEGDLGEKVVHRAGCVAAEQFLRADDNVTAVSKYHQLSSTDGEYVFDAVGFINGSPRFTVEVETKSNDRQGITTDYEKLYDAPGDAFWIIDSKATGQDIINTLADRKGVYENAPPFEGNSYDEINNTLDPSTGEIPFVSLPELLRIHGQ